MYPTLKTWIRNPTPVMIIIITIDSWSSWIAAAMFKSPVVIQDQ